MSHVFASASAAKVTSGKVYFDERWLGPHGIGRFASEIAQRSDFAAANIPGKPLSLLGPWRARLRLQQLRPAHFFSPGFNPPMGTPCSFSLTLHDLIHLDVAEERSLVKTLYYNHIIKPALQRADLVFTVSEYSRRKIRAWSGLPEERIVCVGNGVAQAFSPEGASWRHPKPYLLYVGNQKPHKNVAGMVHAFAACRLSADYDLLLTGTVSPAVAAAAQRAGVADRVIGLGLVPETDLPALYRGATALVMPSRYEGFGLPLVEAMACGTAVLSSNRTALPEVGGDAVGYFDPDDRDSFVAGLDDLADAGLRATRRIAGIARARLFNWDQVAAKVNGAIQQAIGHHNSRA